VTASIIEKYPANFPCKWLANLNVTINEPRKKKWFTDIGINMVEKGIMGVSNRNIRPMSQNWRGTQ
jgi:hypothetical protein